MAPWILVECCDGHFSAQITWAWEVNEHTDWTETRTQDLQVSLLLMFPPFLPSFR